MKPAQAQHSGRYEGLGLPAELYFPKKWQPSEASIRAAQEARERYQREEASRKERELAAELRERRAREEREAAQTGG